LHSLSINSTHGLPRTNADKRRAVSLLLADEEWSQWSDREIARQCQAGHALVSRMRRSASVSKRQIEERRVRRGDKVYEMSTAGKGNSEIQSIPPPNVPVGSAATDQINIPLAEPMTTVFDVRTDFQTAKALWTQLAEVMDRIASKPAGIVLRAKLSCVREDGSARFRCKDLDALLHMLLESEPYASRCPYCCLAHPRWNNPKCTACSGRGWLTRTAYEACAENYREQVLERPIAS
jgi:hypothetical protein